MTSSTMAVISGCSAGVGPMPRVRPAIDRKKVSMAALRWSGPDQRRSPARVCRGERPVSQRPTVFTEATKVEKPAT
jgi:hypothetical protein